MQPARSRRSTRARNRSAEARSASSGSSFILRATLTAANSTSPSSWKRSLGSPARLELVQLVAHAPAAAPRRRGSQSRSRRPGAAPCGRRAGRAGSRAPRRTGRARGRAPSCLILSQFRSTSPAVSRLALAEHVRVAADQLVACSARRPGRGHRRRAPRAAARGSGPGRGRRRARRAASRRRRGGPRRRARRPPRPCAGRSCARPARDPRGIPRAAAGDLVEARERPWISGPGARRLKGS